MISRVFSKRGNVSARGDGFLYDTLPQPLKVQIVQIWDEVADSITDVLMQRDRDIFYGEAAKAVCEECGVFSLTSGARTAREDVGTFFLNQEDVSKCLDVIEIVFACFANWTKRGVYGGDCHLPQTIANGVEKLNARFQEHHVGYELRDGQIARIDSNYLHNQTVAPAIELLREPHLRGANQEFTKAHEHYRHRRFGESMNECLKAFESTMKAICHKRNWPYNQTDSSKRLLDACADNGLFPPYMQSSLAGLRSVLENVATLRNKQSGHGQGVQSIQIDPETASFVIHSTAANILFLASLEKKLPQ